MTDITEQFRREAQDRGISITDLMDEKFGLVDRPSRKSNGARQSFLGCIPAGVMDADERRVRSAEDMIDQDHYRDDGFYGDNTLDFFEMPAEHQNEAMLCIELAQSDTGLENYVVNPDSPPGASRLTRTWHHFVSSSQKASGSTRASHGRSPGARSPAGRAYEDWDQDESQSAARLHSIVAKKISKFGSAIKLLASGGTPGTRTPSSGGNSSRGTQDEAFFTGKSGEFPTKSNNSFANSPRAVSQDLSKLFPEMKFGGNESPPQRSKKGSNGSFPQRLHHSPTSTKSSENLAMTASMHLSTVPARESHLLSLSKLLGEDNMAKLLLALFDDDVRGNGNCAADQFQGFRKPAGSQHVHDAFRHEEEVQSRGETYRVSVYVEKMPAWAKP